MNEDRIPFLATVGGKTDAIARAIIAERVAANQARHAYLKAKGPDCLNLFGGEHRISALIYKKGHIPDGWKRDAAWNRKYGCPEGGVIVIPDKRKKDTFKTLEAELSAIPSLPGAREFSDRINFGFMIRACRWLLCSFETVGEYVIVSVPKWEPPDPHYDGQDDQKEQFVPPDSVQLKHSEYYAMKEKAEAAKPEQPQP